MNSRVLVVALFLLVSGVCALIFQTAWLREFRLIFGASTPASAAVLAIFMGGLGLGNAVLGRRVDASPNPLRLYALFELGISAACVASPFLIGLVRSVYFSLGGQDTLGITGATVVRLLLSTLVIGVPTFLMGGTLPAAARAATAAGDRARVSVGWLYGLNTLGAVIGTLASTFVLLELLGNRATLFAAAAINIVNALLAYRLAREYRVSRLAEGEEAAEPAAPAAKSQGPASRRKGDAKQRGATAPTSPPLADGDESVSSPSWLLYAIAGLVGFAFLLMEMVWYRMLGPILGGTTFTFGIILAVALAGIGVGGALYPLLYRTRIPTIRDLALTCGWEALAIAVPLALGDRIALLAAILRGLDRFGFSGQATAWAIVAAIVIFPAAVVSGIQFPLLIALLGRGRRDLGRQVGQATAWNTVGAMAGSLAGGFGLLPLLSAPGAWRMVVILLTALALAALLMGQQGARRAANLIHPLAVVLLALLCLSATGPTAVWRHSSIGAGRALLPTTTQNDLRQWVHSTRGAVIWEADGQESSVAVTAISGVSFLVNGKSDGNAISDAPTQIMFPLIGALVHPEPKRGLVIGLGTGESAGWLASLPAIEHVDVVELEPVIEHVAKLCTPINHDVLRHPKVRVVFNDGREVLQTSRGQYDLVASEPSNPYRAGVANLYTLEFYESVRRRLAPRGIFMQWLQGYEIDAATLRTVVLTAQRAFGHVEIWETKPADLVLICSLEPLDYDLPRLRQRIREPAMHEALQFAWQTSTVEGVLAHFLANENYAAAIAEQRLGWINTDNRNVLEYAFARALGRPLGLLPTSMREEARRGKFHRPLRIEQGVDWEMVEDQRIAFYAGMGEAPLPATLFTGDRAARAEALMNVVLGEYAGAVAAWDKQSRPPQDLIEVTQLALAFASLGDRRAEPLIEQLQAADSINTDALRGILAAVQKRPDDAARHLAAAGMRLRSQPAGTARVLEAALLKLVQVAESEPRHAPRLYEVVSEPYAVRQLEWRRRITRWLVAQHVGDDAMLGALNEMEPNVPWEADFLKSRLALYRRTNEPRANRAQRDLEEFLYWMPEAFVLQPEN